MWASTDNFALEEDGRLWRVLRDEDGDYAGLLALGPIEGADAPPHLETELAALKDRWEARDGAEDLRGEAEHFRRTG